MSAQNPYTQDYKVIAANDVQSLSWDGDVLYDWVSGNVHYSLDGHKSGPTIIYPYRFDAAAVSPSGQFVALYERLGTKAVVIGPNDLFRELNRSYYHAHVYEYPILFFRLADGREVLAHCPEEYCDLRIEDPVTGETLSEVGTGRISSLFHSRLGANQAGTRLLSAGWFWHPFDTARVFDLKPTTDGRFKLESSDQCWNLGAEIGSVTFISNSQLLLTSMRDAEDFNEGEPGERLRSGMIAVFDLDQQKFISQAQLEEEAGTLMPIGQAYAVGMYDYPKLIEIASGRVLHRWPELKTGQQKSSILWHHALPPPIALDPVRGRFAVADKDQIVVVTLSSALLGATPAG